MDEVLKLIKTKKIDKKALGEVGEWLKPAVC